MEKMKLNCRIVSLLLLFSTHCLCFRVQFIHAGNKLYAKSGKGFAQPTPQANEEIETTVVSQQTSDEAQSSIMSDQTIATGASSPLKRKKVDVRETINNTKMMRNKKLEKLQSIKGKVDILQSQKDLIDADPSVGAVPELVANRMISRIIGFFGVPVFGGLTIFVGAFFESKYYDTVVPPALVAYATQVPFVAGLLGITYAILSSSWDEEDGSLLGIEELNTNLGRIRDGLKRSRDNAKLEEEIEQEYDDLSKF